MRNPNGVSFVLTQTTTFNGNNNNNEDKSEEIPETVEVEEAPVEEFDQEEVVEDEVPLLTDILAEENEIPEDEQVGVVVGDEEEAGIDQGLLEVVA